MKNKKIFFSLLFAIFMLIPSMFIFSSCGTTKEEKYLVTAIINGENENIKMRVNYEETNHFSKMVTNTDNITIEVLFDEGYDHSNLVLKINDELVTPTFSDTDISVCRTMILDLQNINENKVIDIDVSNCGLANMTIQLSEEIPSGSLYAIKRQDVDDSVFVSELSASVTDEIKRISNNSFSVPYGRNFYLLLDPTVTAIKLGDKVYNPSMINGKIYTSNNKYIYYIDGIKENVTVEKYVENYSDNYDNRNFIPNIVTLEIVPTNINLRLGTDKRIESEETVKLADGTPVYSVGSYNGYYMHIAGTDSQILSNYFNKTFGNEDNLQWITDKLYVFFSSYNIEMDNVKFYISSSKEGAIGSNRVEISKDNGCLVINLSDIETFDDLQTDDATKILRTKKFGAEENEYQTGYIYLYAEIDETWLKNNMTGFKVHSNFDDLDNEVRLSDNINNGHTQAYIQYKNGDKLFYYTNTILAEETNKLYLTLGGSNDIFETHFSSARITITNGNGDTVLSPTLFTFNDEEKANNFKYINLSEYPAINSFDEISIEIHYNITDSDSSTHTISFENLDLSSRKLYITTQDVYNQKDITWIEVTNETKNITISVDTPLHYYLVSDNNSNEKLNLAYIGDDERPYVCTVTNPETDLDNKYLTIITENNEYFIYALTLQTTWISENCELIASFE